MRARYWLLAAVVAAYGVALLAVAGGGPTPLPAVDGPAGGNLAPAVRLP